METVNVTVRMERQTRDDAAKLFSELGISTTQAVNMFLKQAVRERGDPLRGDRKARRRARRREARVRKPGASPSTGRRRPFRDLVCCLQHLSFRQARLDAWGHGPLQRRREPRLAAWAPCAGNASTPLMRSSHRMPAKETRGKACGPIGCKEAVRAEIAPARRKASGGGNIVRAVPRACLGLAKSVLRPAPRLMRYTRKEPPRCTNLLNVREYSAD